MSGHAGMPVLPLNELEWIGLVNEKEDVLSDPRKNGRRRVFFLDFYLSWMSQPGREVYARFCERLGVKFPGPTRRRSAMAVPTATADA